MRRAKNDLQLHDINTRLLSLEKKTSKILHTLEFLTDKINDIHNETFSICNGSSTLGNVSPILSPSPKRKYTEKLDIQFEEKIINIDTIMAPTQPTLYIQPKNASRTFAKTNNFLPKLKNGRIK